MEAAGALFSLIDLDQAAGEAGHKQPPGVRLKVALEAEHCSGHRQVEEMVRHVKGLLAEAGRNPQALSFIHRLRKSRRVWIG